MTRRILVIDDDALVRKLVARLLGSRGLEVAAAASGEEGLALIEAGTVPDAIICDLCMPGLSGVEVVGRVREDPEHPAIPILMLTGRGMAQDRDQALAAGAQDYMTKPFSSVDLLEAVDRLLDRAGRQVG